MGNDHTHAQKLLDDDQCGATRARIGFTPLKKSLIKLTHKTRLSVAHLATFLPLSQHIADEDEQCQPDKSEGNAFFHIKGLIKQLYRQNKHNTWAYVLEEAQN